MGIVGRLYAAAFGALLITGCGAFGDGGPARDSSGALIESGTVEAFALQLGDCFNDPSVDEVEQVSVVPCDAAHDFEVYHVFELDDGPYPGTDALKDLWIAGCLAEFESFVGRSFDESVLDISAIFPTEQSWVDVGDREVLCSVTGVDGLQREGSAQGTGA